MKEIKDIVIPKPKRVNDVVLGELVSLAYHKCSPVGDISEITQFLKKEFNLDVLDDDIYRILTPTICNAEAELMYKLYGY